MNIDASNDTHRPSMPIQITGQVTTWWAVVLALLVAGFIPPHAIAGVKELPIAGRWPGFTSGLARGVAIVGDLAYLTAERGGLHVLDVSDPTNPRRVGGYSPSGSWFLAYRAAVSGAHAFVIGEFTHDTAEGPL